MNIGRMIIGAVLVGLIILSYSGAAGSAQAGPTFQNLKETPPPPLGRVESLTRLPILFVANKGQENPEVLFSARTGRNRVWLTKEGFVFDLFRAGGRGREAVRLLFPGARPDVRVSAAEPAGYRENYFSGPDPADWITDIPSARSVLYQDIYENVDLKIYGREDGVEYDWIVKPEGNPSAIRMALEGARRVRIDGSGDMLIESESGTMTHGRPRAYQTGRSGRAEVAASFIADGPDRFGFRVGTYDRSRDLIIDPYVLAFSSYLGGSDADYANSVVFDSEGNLIIAGYTESGDFPGSKPAQTRYDVYVSKFSRSDNELVFTTLLPAGMAGEGFYPPKLAVDAKGNIYLAGTTRNAGFPLKNPFQKKFGGGYWEGFITKLSPKGNGIVYSSFLGGSSSDGVRDIALTAQGEAIIIGQTYSRDFPVKKAFQDHMAGTYDAFVSGVSGDGRSLVFSTYFGGSKGDQATALVVDGQGAIYFAGLTYSSNLPIRKAFQPKFGGLQDIFWAKLSADGQSLLYSTFLGGAGADSCYGIGIDEEGSVYIGGHTPGKFPLRSPFQPVRKGGIDVTLSKFTPDGKSLIYSTFLGGRANEQIGDIAVDPNGTVFLTGFTESSDFPLKAPTQSARLGKADAFLTIVHPSGQSLFFSTLLGGNYRDYGTDLALDGQRRTIAVVGSTNSTDFPTVDPIQDTFQGGEADCFVAKYSLSSASSSGRLAKNQRLKRK